ncbi:MAG: RNase adapter RapZ [Coriobacteriales bacterium]|jgi:UPF0042 nucleotide-binding protein|nr:RNase adapter RapZ [Coriobacteriales bacterium]
MDEQLEVDIPTEKFAGPSLIIITGMAGAGRTEAMHTFEDMGYFCIDNLPPSLLVNLVSLAGLQKGTGRRLAVVCDLRLQEFFSQLEDELGRIRELDISYAIIFLDAEDGALLTRFKETRRRHPLAEGGMTIMSGITREREQLEGVRSIANYVIDTSNINAHDLRGQIRDIFAEESDQGGLRVSVFSFGFKHNTPSDADIVIDVRFLPNPFYEPSLRQHTGLDEEVRDFVLGRDETQEFLKAWKALLDVLMPGYVAEGKQYLSIGLGCTGGQHRSVVLAELTGAYLKEQGYYVVVTHRDLPLAELN